MFLHVTLVVPEGVGVEDAQIARIDLVDVVLHFHVLDELADFIAAEIALIAYFG
jgi:hypothetical protein